MIILYIGNLAGNIKYYQTNSRVNPSQFYCFEIKIIIMQIGQHDDGALSQMLIESLCIKKTEPFYHSACVDRCTN